MRNVISIFQVFLKIFFKDRFNLFMIFFFNAFIMVIFGITMEGKLGGNQVIGISGDNRESSYRLIIERLQTMDDINLQYYDRNDKLSRDIGTGKLALGITITDKEIMVLADTTKGQLFKFLEPLIQISILKSEGIMAPKVEIRKIRANNRNYFAFFFPGILIFSIMQVGLSGGIMLLIQRTKGSLKRLQISPIKKGEFLMGYIGCYLCIMFLQIVGYFLIAKLLFGYEINGNILNVILILSASSLLFVLFGIFLCNACNTVENGNNFNRFFVFPASFLCGVFIPLSALPQMIQNTAWFHPLTYFVEVIREVANFNEPLLSFKYYIVGYIILIFFISIISIKTFKWKEKN